MFPEEEDYKAVQAVHALQVNILSYTQGGGCVIACRNASNKVVVFVASPTDEGLVVSLRKADDSIRKHVSKLKKGTFWIEFRVDGQTAMNGGTTYIRVGVLRVPPEIKKQQLITFPDSSSYIANLSWKKKLIRTAFGDSFSCDLEVGDILMPYNNDKNAWSLWVYDVHSDPDKYIFKNVMVFDAETLISQKAIDKNDTIRHVVKIPFGESGPKPKFNVFIVENKAVGWELTHHDVETIAYDNHVFVFEDTPETIAECIIKVEGNEYIKNGSMLKTTGRKSAFDTPKQLEESVARNITAPKLPPIPHIRSRRDRHPNPSLRALPEIYFPRRDARMKADAAYGAVVSPDCGLKVGDLLMASPQRTLRSPTSAQRDDEVNSMWVYASENGKFTFKNVIVKHLQDQYSIFIPVKKVENNNNVYISIGLIGKRTGNTWNLTGNGVADKTFEDGMFSSQMKSNCNFGGRTLINSGSILSGYINPTNLENAIITAEERLSKNARTARRANSREVGKPPIFSKGELLVPFPLLSNVVGYWVSNQAVYPDDEERDFQSFFVYEVKIISYDYENGGCIMACRNHLGNVVVFAADRIDEQNLILRKLESRETLDSNFGFSKIIRISSDTTVADGVEKFNVSLYDEESQYIRCGKLQLPLNKLKKEDVDRFDPDYISSLSWLDTDQNTVMKRNTFVSKPNPLPALIGGKRKPLGNRNKKKNAARWQATARKVKIAAKKKGKAATERTVYKNSVSGELRIRKATVAKDGTRKYVYVKF